VRYIPDWLSLAESRDLLVADGQHSRSEAEADITLAVRDRKIACRSADKIVVTTFAGRILHPQSPAILNLRRQGRWRISTPRDLAPGDLDFETSAPRKPWIAPGLYVHIGRLELWRRHLERVFSVNEQPKEKHGTAWQPSATEPAEPRNLDHTDEAEPRIDQGNNAYDGDDDADDMGEGRRQRQRQHLRDIVDKPQHDADDADLDQRGEIVEPRCEARSLASRTAAKASVASRREKAEKWKEWVTVHAPAMRLKHPTATQEDLADKLIAQATKEGFELPQRKTVVTQLSALERATKLPSRTTDALSSRTPRS
jgi:hypothetical protein